jgi:hypothetical protein
MSNKVLNNLIFSRMQKRKAMTKRKAMMKAMRKTITKSAQKAESMGKAIIKLTRKAVTKLTRKVKRRVKHVKTRRAKRRAMKGGDYGTSVIKRKVELIPTLAEDSKDLSVSVPGFGTISMEEYHEYMEDLDRRGSAQM